MQNPTTFRALAIAGAMMIFGARGAAAQSTSEVRASGFASVTVTPDLALVTIEYSAGGRTPAIAGRAAAIRANAIRAAIVAIGIPKDSMPTSGRYGWWGAGNLRSEIQVRNNMRDTSYVTQDAFTVRVRDFKLIGRVIDTALAEGAQTISNVEFQATNTDRESIEAIKKATAMAHARAEAVAEAIGTRLGRAMDISIDSPGMALSSAMPLMKSASFARADASTQVVTPDLRVTMTVSGRWELVGPR